MYELSHALLRALCDWAIPIAAACCALAYRGLSGRRMVSTVLVGNGGKGKGRPARP